MISGHQRHVENFSSKHFLVLFYQHVHSVFDEYLTYLINHEELVKTFKKKEYSKIVEEIKTQFNYEIESWAICPVSRIPRYTLLFTDLSKSAVTCYLREDILLLINEIKLVSEK